MRSIELWKYEYLLANKWINFPYQITHWINQIKPFQLTFIDIRILTSLNQLTFCLFLLVFIQNNCATISRIFIVNWNLNLFPIHLKNKQKNQKKPKTNK